MRIEKDTATNKIALLIFIILLVCLLVFLISMLNPKEVYKTTTCTKEEYSLRELTSNITIKSKNEDATYLTFEYLYVYEENQILLEQQFNEEQENITNLNGLDGVNSSITYDPNAELLEIKGNIDYSKLDKESADLKIPYSTFAKPNIKAKTIIEDLKSNGYTCVEAS